jgi:hypothetical protein
VCLDDRRRGRHQGSEDRWEAMRALSSRPFCSCDSRQVSLGDLSAAYRDTTGYLGFLQFLHNFCQLTACEQAEMILYAALDPAVASRARRGDFVRRLDHFDLLQTASN